MARGPSTTQRAANPSGRFDRSRGERGGHEHLVVAVDAQAGRQGRGVVLGEVVAAHGEHLAWIVCRVLRQLLERRASGIDAHDLGFSRRTAYVDERPPVDLLDPKSSDVSPGVHPPHHQVPIAHPTILQQQSRTLG